jgi:hypothetical protein
MTNLGKKIARMRDNLYDARIKVVEIPMIYEHTSYKTMGPDFIKHSVDDVTWDLCMSSAQIQQMLDLTSLFGWGHDHAGQMRIVLDEHSEIKEQWDEFMILLKIVGLDVDVLKLNT